MYTNVVSPAGNKQYMKTKCSPEVKKKKRKKKKWAYKAIIVCSNLHFPFVVSQCVYAKCISFPLIMKPKVYFERCFCKPCKNKIIQSIFEGQI